MEEGDYVLSGDFTLDGGLKCKNGYEKRFDVRSE